MLEPFSLPFFQQGLLQVVLLAVGAGLIGTQIVLRGLAFFAHTVGTATFPGLVLAEGLGIAAALGAGLSGLLVVGGVGLLARGEGERHDAPTALVLVAALGVGVLLASEVFTASGSVEGLLFGSLLLVDGADVALAAGASGVAVVLAVLLEPRWLVTGFDRASARALGVRSAPGDVALLGVIALLAVSALATLGALLVTALLVVPAATTRLVCSRLRSWQLATVALGVAEGAGGLWLAFQLNAPPGAAIAVLGGAVFTATALALGLRRPVRAAA